MIDFTHYTNLKSLEIGNSNFQHVSEVVIDELGKLKSLKIGMNSFTRSINSYGNDTSRSFHLLNCVELESIEIGRYSFSDYGGEFELRNLPSLLSIEMDMNCFYSSSFIVEGIFDTIVDNRFP